MTDLKKTQGFTLLEVLIVLVILAVLAGLAVPAYTSAVEKSRKQEAIASLGAVRASQQRYFATNNTYAASFGPLDFDPTLSVVGNVVHYTYTMISGGAATFICEAGRNGTDFPPGGGVPAGYTVRINQSGVITSQY